MTASSDRLASVTQPPISFQNFTILISIDVSMKIQYLYLTPNIRQTQLWSARSKLNMWQKIIFLPKNEKLSRFFLRSHHAGRQLFFLNVNEFVNFGNNLEINCPKWRDFKKKIDTTFSHNISTKIWAAEQQFSWIIAPWWLSVSLPSPSLLSPKSVMRTWPSRSSSTFSGFRSR